MPKRTLSNRNRRTSARRGGASLRGRGGYLQDLWQNGKKLLPRAVGGALGTLVGKPQAGWDVGAEFSKKVMGWGDYTAPWNVSMNSLVSVGQSPTVANISDAGIRLSHREFIGSVYSSTTFSNNVYYVNPGLSGTFPWLAKIASNFQQYELMGCLVTFKSALTNAVATFSSLGSVIIAADMNAAASPAASQIQLEQMQFVASAKPSESIVAPIECAPRLGGAGVRYIRPGTVPSGASILDFDHCMIQVATSGQPTSGVEIGRLYISYDIKLLNPKMVAGAGSVASYNFTPVSTYCYGVAPITKNFDNIGLLFPIQAGTGYDTVTIPAGSGSEFIYEYSVKSTNTLTATTCTQTFGNCIASTRLMANSLTAMLVPDAGLQSTSVIFSSYVRILDPTLPATLKITNHAVPAGTTVGQVRIMMLPTVGVALSASGINVVGMPFVPEGPDEKEADDGISDSFGDERWAGTTQGAAAASSALPPKSTQGRRP